ncbi:S41 family peptidase [Tenacibaculum xiamenense]|uniref:S41 family peptidase n=1 Tax=Tenacibaculum xiamenense TaxID=1261553 RepID=UPI0038961175
MKKTTILILLFISITCIAQEETLLTQKQQNKIIEKLSDKLLKSYVFEKTAKEVSSKIKQYQFPRNKKDFAKALNDTIRSISKDVHFRFFFSPQSYKNITNTDKKPEVDHRKQIRQKNYGFEKVALLPDNIGYLKINQFHEYDEAFQIAKASMEFLQHADSYIIDLKDNGGGSGKMGRFLGSYFFKEGDHRLLLENYNREKDELVQEWTLVNVPGKRRPNATLYIIIGKNTGSAAEAFPYFMQANKRATIVGENSWGGAHSGAFIPIEKDFIAFIPSGRVTSPITKSNWEDVGVTPDIKISTDLALDFIKKEILVKKSDSLMKEMKKGNLPKEKEELLTWKLNYFNAKTTENSAKFSKTLAKSYSKYQVSFKNDNLYFGKKRLIPFSNTIFYAEKGYTREGDLIIEFDHAINPTKLFYKVIDWDHGKVTKFELKAN